MFGKRQNSAFGDAGSDKDELLAPSKAPKGAGKAAPAALAKPALPAGAVAPRRAAIDASVRAALGAPQAANTGVQDRRNQSCAAPVVTEIVTPATDGYLDTKAMVAKAMFSAIDTGKISQLGSEDAALEIRELISELVTVKDISMSASEQDRLAQDIVHDVLGYGPLQPLLMRDDISDIMVNGAYRVFVEIDGVVEMTNVQFRDNDELLRICQRIVSAVGRRVDESSPMCDARLPDGSRVNVILPPLGLDGPTLTIRKFKKDRLTLRKLVDFGTITPAGARVLAVIGRSRCNVLVSGGTGSGKTTLLNCLTAFIDAKERIVTCEDAAELQLQQPHVVRLETRPPNLEGQGQVAMRDLIKNCLRMRPERIIIGEVRGAEAFDLLQAMNTGHNGSMGTLHANSPREALSRIEAMINMGYGLTSRSIREMIASSVDVIIQVARLRDGSRRVTHITEVVGMEGDVVTTQDLFVYDFQDTEDDGKIVGRHRSTGIVRPKMWEQARYFGLHGDLEAALTAAGADET